MIVLFIAILTDHFLIWIQRLKIILWIYFEVHILG